MNRLLAHRKASLFKLALFPLLLMMSLEGVLLPTLANSPLSRPTSSLKISQSMNAQQQIIAVNTEFGFKLFSQLTENNRQENVFVSPLSITLALSLLYNGASGKTQQDMAQSLGFENLSLEEINQANQTLQTNLNQQQSSVELAIANSLWARKGVSFERQFLENSKAFYQAQVTNLDFTNPQSVNIINNWVKENTRNKIDEIIDAINSDSILFLINAIYFKGTWQTKFDENLTQNRSFNLLNGNQKQHPMMSRQGDYQYYETPQFQSVSIPYGDDRIRMYIFLPKQETQLDTFLEQLTPQNWKQWLSQFRERSGLVQIPRFKLEYETQLNDILKALGMNSIFKGAEFAKMTSLTVEVDEVKHKTFVEVNEEGTEAAAVTSIGIRATSIRPTEEPFRMIVDRPFFCAIYDRQTQTVLFLGKIVEPK